MLTQEVLKCHKTIPQDLVWISFVPVARGEDWGLLGNGREQTKARKLAAFAKRPKGFVREDWKDVIGDCYIEENVSQEYDLYECPDNCKDLI
jgi:hypothetical protein